MHRKVVVIDAIISAGKSTLLQILQEEFPNSVCIPEPVDIWEKSGELQKFYHALDYGNRLTKEDGYQKIISTQVYKFQTYTFITRLKRVKEMVEKNPNCTLFFLERSIFSDAKFFVEMLHTAGKLSESDYKMYHDWWEMWSSVMPLEITHFVYLNPSVSECMRRLKSRNRGSESGVSLEYQTNLKMLHDEFLTERVKIDDREVPCLNLETNDDFRNSEHREKVVSQIRKFIGCSSIPNEKSKRLKLVYRVEISDHDGYCSGSECNYTSENKVYITDIIPSEFSDYEIGEYIRYEWNESNIPKGMIPEINYSGSNYCIATEEAQDNGLEKHDYRINVTSTQIIQ